MTVAPTHSTVAPAGEVTPVESPNHPSTGTFTVNKKRHTSREALRVPGKGHRTLLAKIPVSERMRLMNEATRTATEVRRNSKRGRVLAVARPGQIGVGTAGIGGTIHEPPHKTPTPANATPPKRWGAVEDPTANSTAAESDDPESAKDTYTRMVDERARTIVELAVLSQSLGRIPGTVMTEACERLGLSRVHLRALVRDFRKTNQIPVPDPRPRIGVPDMWKAKVAYFAANGNAALAYDEFLDPDRDLNGMSKRTWQRVVANEWDPAIRAAASEGYRGLITNQMFNQDHIPYAGYAYGMDHTFLPIRVIPERGYKPVWVWLTTCIDLYSRVLLAYRVSLETPNTATVLDVFTDAVKGWYTEEGVFVGGKPQFVRSDRGADFISKALTAHLFDLGIERQLTNPYSSWENGRVERFNGTIDKVWAPTVPGFYKGGATEYDRRVMKTGLPDESMITYGDLDDAFGEFGGEYNLTERKSLGHVSPLQLWTESMQVHRPAHASDDQLSAGVLGREQRKVHSYGVESRGGIYQSSDLAALRKDGIAHVEVRYHNHDKSFVYLFHDDKFVGKAYRGGPVSDTLKFAVLSMRRAQSREYKALMREADRVRAMQEQEAETQRGVDEKDRVVVPEVNYTDDEPVSSNGLTEARLDRMSEALDPFNGVFAGEDGVPTVSEDPLTGLLYDKNGEVVDPATLH